jgi:hypothetical protein
MDALQKRKYLIETVISPFLKDNGFTKASKVYYVNGEMDTRLIDMISNRFNSKESVQFGFMIHFYNPLVYRFFVPGGQSHKPPKVPSYIHFHIDQLLSVRSYGVHQYCLGGNVDINQMADRLHHDLNELLAVFAKLNQPLEYLKLIHIGNNQKQMIKIYCLILLLQANDMVNATILFNDVYNNFDGHESVKENLKKLGLENKLIS